MKSRNFLLSKVGNYGCCLITLAAMFVITVSIACAQGSADIAGQSVIASQPLTMRPSFYQQFVQLIPMFTIVMGIYYLMVLRPKVGEERAHKSLVDGLVRGDTVVTSGGILGKIISRSGDFFSVEIAKGTVVQIHEAQIDSRSTVVDSKPA